MGCTSRYLLRSWTVHHLRVIVSLLSAGWIVAACGRPKPTATSAPSPTPAETSLAPGSASPTATVQPVPTPTPLPTVSASATPVATAPPSTTQETATAGHEPSVSQDTCASA